ncbi:MAG: DUF3471 domain-containing protein [Kosmotoga sp.]|nr:MAG: DUF3471 domain-containing protein [Kosmotoga sp.]
MGWVMEEFEGMKILWHNGDTSGCHAMILTIPKDKLGTVILSNMGSYNVLDTLAKAFVQLAIDKDPNVLKGLDEDESQEEKQETFVYDHLPLEEDVGTYQNEIFEEMIIEIENSTLKGKVANGSYTLIFEHENRDLFTLHLLPYLKDLNQVSFILNEKGKVEGFFLWESSSPDPYWFEKVEKNK